MRFKFNVVLNAESDKFEVIAPDGKSVVNTFDSYTEALKCAEDQEDVAIDRHYSEKEEESYNASRQWIP